MKKHLWILLCLITAVLVLHSCSDSEEPVIQEEVTLEIVPADPGVFFSVEGGTERFTVNTNQDIFSVKSNLAWCTVHAEGNTVVITAGGNSAPKMRETAIVTVTAGKGTAAATIEIKVNQEGHDIAYLSLEPDKDYEFGAAGADHQIDVETNKSWTAELDDDSWFTVERQLGNGKIVVTSPTNTSAVDTHSAILTVVAGSGNNTAVKTLTVSQVSDEAVTLTVTPEDDHEFPIEGGTLNLTVESNKVWSAELADDRWFEIDVDTERGKITVTAPENGTYYAYSTTLTVSAGVDTNTTSHEIQISQLAPDPAVDLSEFAGLANCYVIDEPGFYCLPTKDAAGNSIEGDKAYWIWCTAEWPDALSVAITDFIDPESLIYESDYIYFNTSQVYNQGNTVIALATVEDGIATIRWSWHLWFTDQSNYKTAAAGQYLNMPVGATANEPSVRNFGLLYQWCRKEPFPAGKNFEFWESAGTKFLHESSARYIINQDPALEKTHQFDNVTRGAGAPMMPVEYWAEYITMMAQPATTLPMPGGTEPWPAQSNPCPAGYSIPERDLLLEYMDFDISYTGNYVDNTYVGGLSKTDATVYISAAGKRTTAGYMQVRQTAAAYYRWTNQIWGLRQVNNSNSGQGVEFILQSAKDGDDFLTPVFNKVPTAASIPAQNALQVRCTKD